MASFDIVCEVETQEVDNAVNNLKKELQSRYDFQGSSTEVEFNKKDSLISMTTNDEMKMRALREMLIASFVRRKVDTKFLDFQEIEKAGGSKLKRNAKLRAGIGKDDAKKIVNLIKDLKLKVQTSIMDDKVRVTAKKIDDLQDVIQKLRSAELDIPLQFTNMKS